MGRAVRVDTPDGPGELVLDEAESPAAVLLLGHGAGGDVDTWDLDLLASRLPVRGVSVARFRQPYRVAGRRIFSSLPGLDRGWACALAEVRATWPGLPLFAGGRSAGARAACRGVDPDQRGLVLLAFPLHQPGKPERIGASELIAVRLPVLVVQGGADTFGTTDEVRAAVGDKPGVRLVELAGAGHSLGPTARTPAAEVVARERTLLAAVAGFLSEHLAEDRS
jgi:predicted alpha/beta-hydrolase family hydrolase